MKLATKPGGILATASCDDVLQRGAVCGENLAALPVTHLATDLAMSLREGGARPDELRRKPRLQ